MSHRRKEKDEKKFKVPSPPNSLSTKKKDEKEISGVLDRLKEESKIQKGAKIFCGSCDMCSTLSDGYVICCEQSTVTELFALAFGKETDATDCPMHTGKENT